MAAPIEDIARMALKSPPNSKPRVSTGFSSQNLALPTLEAYKKAKELLGDLVK